MFRIPSTYLSFSLYGDGDIDKDKKSIHLENFMEFPKVFENTNLQNQTESDQTIKEPEMFEENNQEEDFEIPAFLR